MQQNDLLKFTTLIISIGELYKQNVSDALIEIYWESLRDYDFNAISQAITSHVKNPENGQFMPKPADIIKFIDGKPEDNALLAWSKVDYNRNAYESIIFDDPVIHAVIRDMGGWVQVCSGDVDALPFLKNEFVKRYCGYVSRKKFYFPKFLPGRFDNEPRTKKIIAHRCDEKKALAVYERGGDSVSHESPGLENIFDEINLLAAS